MWGVREITTKKDYGANILGGREAIPYILELFRAYQIKATWAVVGLLAFENKKQLMQTLPKQRPQYKNKSLSPYENSYFDLVGSCERDDPFHFGHSLIQKIIDNPGMELACHTFSHYYCLEPGQAPSEFKEDLLAFREALKAYSRTSNAIVFPRNQVRNEYLDICRKIGYTHYRGTESAAYYQPQTIEDSKIKVRFLRAVDSFINLSGCNAGSQKLQNGLVNVPSSRFLRPVFPRYSCLNSLHLNRITTAMTDAAKSGGNFHLWWHPHNFGIAPMESLKRLELILRHYRLLRDRYGMISECISGIPAPLTRNV
jgi:hypothetical protein